MSEPPIFELDQPNGRRLQIDLSAGSVHCDFTFTATNLATGRVTDFDAYHTGERFLFLDVLHRLAYSRSPGYVLTDITRIRDDVSRRTAGLIATSEAEHNFDSALPRWLPSLTTEPAAHRFTASFDRRYTLALTPTDQGLTLSWQRGGAARPRDPAVHLPTSELWRFAAGMIWRSYGHDRRYSHLSRVSTTAYLTALDTFESAIRPPAIDDLHDAQLIRDRSAAGPAVPLSEIAARAALDPDDCR